MTCKDCKQWKICTDRRKSGKVNIDGDSWANWCDHFNTIHSDKEVKQDGIIVHQTGYNWHVTMWDEATGKLLMHASCTKEQTEKELLEFISLYKDVLLPKAKEIFAEEGNENEL